MPLYTNVTSLIKSPQRYHEAKSHLGDSYWNANRILNDLERLEENHNQQVASLITTLHKEIIDTIHNRNKHRHCNIAVSIHQHNVSMASDQPWYNIDCIYGHFRDEANHNHGKLTVVSLVGQNTAVLRREKPAEIAIVYLSGSDLSNANLSNVETDNRTNFQNVILTSAYPSSIVTDITTRSIGKESNAKSLSVDTEPSIHRITRYTSDGKPINK